MRNARSLRPLHPPLLLGHDAWAFISEWFWFFLLLPIAAVSGWIIGRRGGERHSDTQVSRLSTTYFRGLNYLLNEQQDKAIEIFLQIAEVDKDTVETQFALGHLFRRRGEVDRAIRLHQSLVARHGLSEEQKTRRVLALGEDYMRAGLLDRAETLFTDLVAMGVHAPQALRQLIGDLPVRARLVQGDRARAPYEDLRRADGQGDRAFPLRARRAARAAARTRPRRRPGSGLRRRQRPASAPA